MRLPRWLGAAMMTLMARAAAPVMTTGSPLAAANASPSGANMTTTTTTATTAPANALEDRVVLLVADRADPSVWCLGLLIAPRAVLTYAHCVSGTSRPMAWAFFGSTDSAFDQWRAAEANPTQPRDGDVGEMDAWGSIVQTIVHPKYVADSSTPTMDLAVLQLQEPRVTTDAFSLVSNMDEIDAADAFNMEAYTLSNTFVTGTRDLKLTPRGTFRKVPWSYCAAQQTRTTNLGSVWKLFAAPPKGQVCVVASVVEARTSSEFANSFVLLENKLVGLSIVGTKSSTVAHRFSFLSEQAAFITEATQKTNVWITISNSRLVVGGKDSPALKGYVTGLRLTKSGANFCLGALIAPKFVLTAAHCVQGVNFSQVSVGSMYVASEVDGEQIKVKRTIVHPNYEAATFKNDYAVVELEYISIQAPIFLYNGAGAETAAGTRLKFYGYGPNNGAAPGQLQSVELPVVDKKQCKAVLQPPVLDDAMMCAGGEEGKDACKGDSGGPLVYESKSPASLVAMASYGRGCAIKGVPAVYAVVSMAGSFINSTVEGHRWLTAYGSDSTAATTTAPASSSGAATTPAPVRQQASKPPSAPAPATPSSTPSMTRFPSPEARSGDALLLTPTPAPAAKPRGSAVLDELQTNEGWKPVSTISLKDTSSSSSLAVGEGYSQLTRDIISTTVLSPRSGLAVGASRLEQLTKYSGASSVQFFSDSGLGDIAALISAFDARPLRRRVARFSAAARDNATCAAHR